MGARAETHAQFATVCPACHQDIEVGDRIRRSPRGWRHAPEPGRRGMCPGQNGRGLGPVTVTHVDPRPTTLHGKPQTCTTCIEHMPIGTAVQRTRNGWRHAEGCH